VSEPAASVVEFAAKHRFGSGFELDAAFTAGAGVTALVGPSGSGKTTVLAMIAGVLRPRAARIAVTGTLVCDSAAGVWVPPERRGVGMVFQDHLLFPHKTVLGNLEFGAAGVAAPERAARLKRFAGMLELSDLLDRMPATLSGGQKQRVALGRALMAEPKLLLLDEPLNAQDAALRVRIRGDLARVFGETKLPAILVSHDEAEVRELAARVVRIEAGKIVGNG
jgi:molybdate transport system ATP-binding protein